MLKFMMKFTYSSASWARMLTVSDDRTSAVAALLEHLGGKIESMHWEVEDAAAYVVGYLPDSISAAAEMVAATRTGGFKDVQVSQLLTQEQLSEVVALARSSEGIYHPPRRRSRRVARDTRTQPGKLSTSSGPVVPGRVVVMASRQRLARGCTGAGVERRVRQR
jgi:hypothetical protein